MRRGFFAKVAVAVAALALVATACQRGGDGNGDGGTTQARSLLDTVKERGTLKCGVNETVPGFGFLNPDSGEIEGFDIEFCKAIAAAVLGDPAAHELLPISAEERFSALRAGTYDVLVRNSTWTSSRDGAEGVAFGHPNFYDGQGMMVAADSDFQSITDMDGRSVCVTSGTTTELNLADFASANDIELPPVTFEENPQLQEAFLAGRCEGWTSDASQLAGIRSQWPEGEGGPEAVRILDEIISKEPLAPAVVDGDTKWYDVVNWVTLGLIAAEEYGVTQSNVADQAANPPDPNVANMLGAPVEDEETGQSAPFDSGLGLEPDFMVDVITAVGNYGEIYDRTVGPDTSLGLERGLNAQYLDGGLQYAPPIR
ncbi:MAG TPA: amino acid ABC transporter substrate-binding protein [Actinomycetota bacterium]|jgi:general L-amino acid transport system substrate-binding protein|nr:amino acid ABC transporter substrate-binding protein [Actinomycetota bacterium]